MKKILAIVVLALTMNANAFWNNNNSMPWGGNNMNMPWGSGIGNYNNYNGSNNWNGYQQDNGFFAYNPYEYYDPRWYAEEMSNMFDEFDGNNNYYQPTGYGYNPRNYTLGNTTIDYDTSKQQKFLRQNSNK